MPEIAHNTCYGGFTLSDECADLMVTYGCEHPHDAPRHDPALLRAINVLGRERSAGPYCKIGIEIIRGNRYRIDEYDGIESVIETKDNNCVIPDDHQQATADLEERCANFAAYIPVPEHEIREKRNKARKELREKNKFFEKYFALDRVALNDLCKDRGLHKYHALRKYDLINLLRQNPKSKKTSLGYVKNAQKTRKGPINPLKNV
uniref:Rho termination factor N-terminal domain-containing protein n=1 Tax=Marseillevirus LCMAC103 TaxID=2506604 RepID=A0A481YUI0_9VIRU|nr:MAG: hypothetical protein LCMAC103_00800 [Marseillevirus LCMAC103]